MKGESGNRNIFLGILLVGLIGGGYYFFTNSSQSNLNDLGAVSAADAIGGTGEEQDLINQLLRLRSLRLDEKIFTDPAFTSLTDFSQTIPPEPVGRANPFLPVGVAPSQPIK
jgi:hypothetical protein